MKKIFGKAILFDPRKLRAIHGSEKMNNLFLSMIKKEQPDYIFANIRRDEVTISTMEKVRQASPKTKIISFSGDDERDFEPLKRYQALFVDCTLVAQVDYLKNYLKDGINNIYPTFGINTDIFKPIDTKKIYDVTFIGKPLKPRIDIMRFLIKNKVNLRIFGPGWEAYPEFKELYLGALPTEDMAKTISQSRINLSLSKNADGVPHLKGRTFELAACKSFCLVEYFKGYLEFFEEGKEIIMVKNKKDLLSKINYYLKNEKKGEKIAENAYKKAVKNHSVLNEFKNMFKEIMERPEIFRSGLPKIKENIIMLDKKDLEKKDLEIENKIKAFDYISFSDGNDILLDNKDQLQTYSLKKTGKDASCCDYYVHDRILGNYLMTNVYKAFNYLSREQISQMLCPNQIMVRKKFFLANLNEFRKFFRGENNLLFNKKNTCLISIPLVAVKTLRKMDPGILFSAAFHKEFAIKAYLLMKQKKILINPYIYRLAYLIVRDPLLRHCFIDALKNRKNWVLQSNH